LLDDVVERHRLPGAAIAVGVGGQLVEAASGVLNRATGVEATAASLFQIGSVTKIWTAALVMQLVGEGLVDLDAPVRRYLPEFGVIDASASGTVTVRQLLSHTGGFDGDLFEDTGRGDDAVDRLLAFMRTNASQIHPPGELFSYCNAGYCVLGALVAKLRGGTWESAMRERLVDPLGVTHLALFAEEAVLFRSAVGHVRDGDGLRVTPRWQLPRSNGPAGSMPCAAPRELVRLGRMFLADGVAADGTRVLPAGTFAAMREEQITLPQISARFPRGWGLGFMLFDWDGVPVVGHDGDTIGQVTVWRIVPHSDVVVAINVNGDAVTALIDDLLAPVLADVAGVRVPARPTAPAEPVLFTPDGYTGRFAGPLVTHDVVAADGGLDVTTAWKAVDARLDEPPTTTRYLAVGDDRFVAADPNAGPPIIFMRGGRYLYSSRVTPRVSG
jgi:CubicO group peptidase (beta-lactamase class C family)